MNREPVWRAVARDDLHDAIAWYGEQSARVAGRFIRVVDSVVEQILDNPHRFPFSIPGFRWAKVRGFPYQIHYAEVGNAVVVFAVWHEKRDREVLNRRLIVSR